MNKRAREGAQSGPEIPVKAESRTAGSHHLHGHDCDHEHDETLPVDERALISARGLRVERGGRAIISSVDIDIALGEIVTLIGPNGSGKTTLVRALLGLEKTNGGTLRRSADLRVGYVPQRFDVDTALPMTVDRFLALGNAATGARIEATLDEVGARALGQRQLRQLSGGELQRVILARALLGDPTLLVLDEPVRGVDYVGEAELYTLIGRLRERRGLGVLLVSHDLHVVMAASDRVICLNRHVCCSGVPETVAQHPEYVRLFGPEAATSFGVYHHHHDHRHDLAGDPAPALDADVQVPPSRGPQSA
jgi:zinc transport system ATP-binding protein